MDKLIKAITKDGFLRVYAVETTETVNAAQKFHTLSPVCCAALGRLMTAGLMMGAMLKGKEPSLTLQVKGDGPIGRMASVSDSMGNVKGYCANPVVDIPLREDGKLDVGTAVGQGMLGVIKDLKMTPSVVALGVLVDRDYSVKCAGGYIIQVMPECDDATLTKLENSIQGLMSVTEMLDKGMSVEEMLKYVMLGFDIEILETMDVGYKCDCSKERMERAIISLGKGQIQSIIDETGEAEICCNFCDRRYTFGEEDLKKFLETAK